MPDDDLLTPEELAVALSVSRSYIRLILDAGAPQTDGLARGSDIVDWSLNNIDKVRALAGMSELPPRPEGATPPEAAMLKVKYHLQTVLEYQAARTQDPDLREAMLDRVEEIRSEDFPPAE